MISPELLRNFPHFSGLSYECLKAIAMISDEREFEKGAHVSGGQHSNPLLFDTFR